MKNNLNLILILLIALVIGCVCPNSSPNNQGVDTNTRQNTNNTNQIKTLVATPTATILPQKQTPKPSQSIVTETNPKPSATIYESKTLKETKKTNPSGASARCRDGTLSYSQNRRGTCSHHGGVAEWF
jgi:hypothetical protein